MANVLAGVVVGTALALLVYSEMGPSVRVVAAFFVLFAMAGVVCVVEVRRRRGIPGAIFPGTASGLAIVIGREMSRMGAPTATVLAVTVAIGLVGIISGEVISRKQRGSRS